VITRRALLGRAAAAGAGIALARPGSAAASEPETATVIALIWREDAATAAYERAARATGLPLLARIAALEAQRTHALRVQLEALTVPPGHRGPHDEQHDPAAAVLAAATSRREALAAAIALEEELARVYADAARTLVDAGLLQSVATIAAGHAQQLAVLRVRAGRPPLDEVAVSQRWHRR
jgi:hypothetical protein